MKSKSVWEYNGKRYPRLEGDSFRDTVVIGGGIAGYLTAFKLSESGFKVTLIEADALFSGTTGKTTAKITCNQGNLYAEIYARYGRNTAKLYYEAQSEGMREFERLIRKYNVDCDFTKTEGYIFTRGHSGRLENTCSIMHDLGAECEISSAPRLGSEYAIKMDGQYLFDPVKFLVGLPAGFEIYEGTRAVDVDVKRKIITTPSGKIKARRIIIATHFPVINSRGLYFLKLRKSTSYTVAIDEKTLDGMYLEDRDDGISVRPYSGGTLIGGSDHRTGRKKSQNSFTGLIEKANALSGNANITNGWCTEDVMTFDGMPMAGKYYKNAKDVYVITGFNKWGMTNSIICAGIISDLINGNKNRYAKIFSPQRKIKGSMPDFVSNALTNIKSILSGYLGWGFDSIKSIPAGSGKVVRYRGKKRAVYRDYDGKLYVVGRMCPHMHGELEWNADAKSWDCPCHGSRFDIYGNIISEPSVKCCKLLKDEEIT